MALAVSFWNASVHASKLWEHPRVKELNELKRRLCGPQASRDDAATFELLTTRRSAHWRDPRLVETWTFDADAAGVPRFACTMALPDGVQAEVPPPVEKRVSIGGRFLDEVRIPMGGNAFLAFPVERHRGVVGDDGTATVRAMMPSALELFADGVLPRIHGDPVEVVIGGRKLGLMVLAEVRCGSEHFGDDIAVLVFRPASVEVRRLPGT